MIIRPMLLLVLGVFFVVLGGAYCNMGHEFSLAGRYEATTVGRIVSIEYGRHGQIWKYVFSVNGVKYNDSSRTCRTPLAPGACNNNGPVLVYYSFQPFQQSRLQDFVVASKRAYEVGETALAIGFILLIGVFIAKIKEKRDREAAGEPDPDKQKGASKSGGMPDDIHILPGE
jgi:hypothetical protein